MKYPIPPPYRTRGTANPNGHCLWCGEKLKSIGELPDKRYYSSYFCPSNEKDCRSKYNSKFTWDYIRRRVFDRDNYTCLNCAFHPPHIENYKKAEYLECDHIMAVALGGCWWDEANLQTLCIDCHRNKTRVDLRKIRAISTVRDPLDERPNIIPLTKFLS